MSVKPLPADAHGLSAAHRCAAVDEHQREAALRTGLVAETDQSDGWLSMGTISGTMFRIPRLPKGTTWINYIRCHDDIGFRNASFPDAHVVCRQRLRCR